MLKRKLTLVVLIICLFSQTTAALAGTVLQSYKYAWSSNLGYMNFENVNVSDSALSGYAWSANAGWVKFNPAMGGVFNDGNGNLSGSAWGENLGWIDFGNVSINPTTGKFSGTASGDLAGIINFDCPTYCDVRTDWTKTVAAPQISGGGSLPSHSSNPIRAGVNAPAHVETHNSDLIVGPDQSGTFTQDTPDGPVVLDVPAKASAVGTLTFIISTQPVVQDNSYLVLDNTRLVNGLFYDIVAIDQDGNYVHSFSNLLNIILPVPTSLYGKNLGVYWLNETNWQWVLIPDAIFSIGKVTFQTDHLTKFAVFEVVGEVPQNIQSPNSQEPQNPQKPQNPQEIKKLAPNLLLPVEKKPKIPSVLLPTLNYLEKNNIWKAKNYIVEQPEVVNEKKIIPGFLVPVITYVQNNSAKSVRKVQRLEDLFKPMMVSDNGGKKISEGKGGEKNFVKNIEKDVKKAINDFSKLAKNKDNVWVFGLSGIALVCTLFIWFIAKRRKNKNRRVRRVRASSSKRRR